MDEKKMVFVSVPMSGKDEALIERQIQITKAWYLKVTNQNVKDVAFYDNLRGCRGMHFPNLKNEALGYLGHAITKLGRCDEAVFGKDWQSARGCIIEKDVCDIYGIKTYEVTE